MSCPGNRVNRIALDVKYFDPLCTLFRRAPELDEKLCGIERRAAGVFRTDTPTPTSRLSNSVPTPNPQPAAHRAGRHSPSPLSPASKPAPIPPADIQKPVRREPVEALPTAAPALGT